MKKLSILLIALLLLSVVLCGCGGNAAKPAEEGAVRDTVHLAVDQSFLTADPHSTNLVVDREVYHQVYEPLVYVGGDGVEQFMLAESYEMSEDGLTYTFKLRSGVKFHNGETFTAQDAVFSYERAIASSYFYSYTYMIDSVEAIDESTFAVHLKFAYAPFIAASSWVMIVNEKYFTDPANDLSVTDCGTGPFMVESFNAMEEVSVVRFDEYWRGPAALRRVVWKLIPETSTQVVALQSGELDLLRVPYSNWKEVSSNENFGTLEQSTAHISFVTINTQLAPFDNKLVRQAIAYCINRTNMVNMASDGIAKPAYFLTNPEAVSFASEAGTKYDLDIEKAKSLLSEAGYPDGLDVGIIATLGGVYEKLAQVLQANLADIGISGTVQVYESSSYVADVFGGNYGIGIFGGDIGNDADNFSILYQEAMINMGNICRCALPELDKLLAAASAESDPVKRQAIYDEANVIITDEALYLPILYAVDTYAFNKDLNFVGGTPQYFAYDWSWKQ